MIWLWLLVFVLAIDVLVLLFDAWLAESGRFTITARVKRCPALGLPLVGWQLVGAGALCLHFWT